MTCTLTWWGHSTSTWQDGGTRVLFDPVLTVRLVDVITDTKIGDMRPQFDKKTGRSRKRKWLRVTLGDHRPKVTATFFNADWMIDKLVSQTRIMLSGEVGYFKGTVQLTHPAFLVLESPLGKNIGTKSLKTIAAASGATGDELLSAFEQEFFPIYPASAKVQSWDIYACVHSRRPRRRSCRPGSSRSAWHPSS